MSKGQWKRMWVGGWGDWMIGTEGELDDMNSECYTICWQIELRLKNIQKNPEMQTENMLLSVEHTLVVARGR